MTRSGFLFFNIFLVASIYGLIYATGTKPPEIQAAVKYALTFFSLPYIVLVLLMAFFDMIRWFMGQNPDVAKEGGSFLWAAILTILLTFAAAKFVSGHLQGPLLGGILY